MIKYSVLIMILALRLFYQPSSTRQATTPFTSPGPSSVPSITTVPNPVKLISFNGTISNDRVFLQWQVDENETTDQFEVEKSVDGKNFTMVALVFSTDKPETDSYQFYEKAGNQKVSYRIKLINKNRKTEYSRIVEINPNV